MSKNFDKFQSDFRSKDSIENVKKILTESQEKLEKESGKSQEFSESKIWQTHCPCTELILETSTKANKTR